MPIVLITTSTETGQVNLAPYSLIFPHYINGANEWAMMLISRGSSNTAQNLLREKRCCLNFIPHSEEFMHTCVMLGYPGETTEQKMKDNTFTLIPANPNEDGSPSKMPEYVEEAIQIFECEWDDSYPRKHNEELEENRFLLRIKRIVMKPEWKEKLIGGEEFPILPINFGFRDNINFWFSANTPPYKIRVPASKSNTIETVIYACDRCDPSITWEREACERLRLVPPIFLKDAVTHSVEAAKAEGLSVITAEFIDKLRDKREAEKANQSVDFTMEWDYELQDLLAQVPKSMLEMMVGNAEKWAREKNYPKVTFKSLEEMFESMGMDLGEMLKSVGKG